MELIVDWQSLYMGTIKKFRYIVISQLCDTYLGSRHATPNREIFLPTSIQFPSKFKCSAIPWSHKWFARGHEEIMLSKAKCTRQFKHTDNWKSSCIYPCQFSTNSIILYSILLQAIPFRLLQPPLKMYEWRVIAMHFQHHK